MALLLRLPLFLALIPMYTAVTSQARIMRSMQGAGTERNTIGEALAVSKAIAESRDLSNLFARAAEHAPVGSATKALFSSFEICGKCNKFIRWGEANDGGYLMCTDGLDQSKAVYSMGVEHHDKWSEDALKALKVPVNQFDCTVDYSACTECHFHKKCIVAADGSHPVPHHEHEGWTLEEALKRTGQGDAPDGSLLMKMDVEGSEWPLLAEEHTDVLKKFGQLIVEFHWLQHEEQHPLYNQAVQKILNSGFKVAHMHGNNWNTFLYKAGDLQMPNVIEVTFVRSGTRDGGCAKDQIYESLDTPNKASLAELPMAHFSD